MTSQSTPQPGVSGITVLIGAAVILVAGLVGLPWLGGEYTPPGPVVFATPAIRQMQQEVRPTPPPQPATDRMPSAGAGSAPVADPAPVSVQDTAMRAPTGAMAAFDPQATPDIAIGGRLYRILGSDARWPGWQYVELVDDATRLWLAPGTGTWGLGYTSGGSTWGDAPAHDTSAGDTLAAGKPGTASTPAPSGQGGLIRGFLPPRGNGGDSSHATKGSQP